MSNYFWNFNEHEEIWQNSCPTIEDCIEEAKWEKEYMNMDDEHVYIGEVETHVPFIDVEYLIDNIKEQAWSDCGECCDGWLDGLKIQDEDKLEERLNKVLLEWLEEINGMPGFGRFIKVNKYNLETGKESEGE